LTNRSIGPPAKLYNTVVSVVGLSIRCTFLVPFRTFQCEEFEDIIGIIRSRKSKKDRQHSGQMKKDKRTNNDLQNIHIKLKIE
jgi:hypothetical protein